VFLVYLEGLFIGRLGGLIITSKQPPNHHVYTEHRVMRALQSFYIFIYFISNLLDGDMCPLLADHHQLGHRHGIATPMKMAEGIS
jgi:hypothetical protein